MSRYVDVIWIDTVGVHSSSFAERRAKMKLRVDLTPTNKNKVAFRMEYICNQSCREEFSDDEDATGEGHDGHHDSDDSDGGETGRGGNKSTSYPTGLRSERRRKRALTSQSACSARLIVRTAQGIWLTQFQCTADQVHRKVVEVWELPSSKHPVPVKKRVSAWVRGRVHALANSFGMTLERVKLGMWPYTLLNDLTLSLGRQWCH